MRRRIRRIRRGADRSAMKASSYAVMWNKRMAPRKSGTLMQNIRKYKKSLNHWVVESWVPSKGMTSGKYNFWVNENISTVRLPTTPNFKKDAPRAPRSYSSTKHTGVPGYFNKTAKKTAKYFHNLNVKLIKTAIGGT